MRRRDDLRDILLAGDRAFEVALHALPAVFLHRHHAAVHQMRHAEHVERNSAGAGGDSRGEDVEIVRGERARDHREQSRPVARHHDKFAEFEIRKMAIARDHRPVAERAHQIKVQRDVVFRHGEEIALGHLIEERLDLGRRRARRRELLAYRVLHRRQPPRRIHRLAIALLHQLERAQVQVAQQHVAPVVVNLGCDRAHVRVSQQVERLQTIDRARPGARIHPPCADRRYLPSAPPATSSDGCAPGTPPNLFPRDRVRAACETSAVKVAPSS